MPRRWMITTWQTDDAPAVDHFTNANETFAHLYSDLLENTWKTLTDAGLTNLQPTTK